MLLVLTVLLAATVGPGPGRCQSAVLRAAARAARTTAWARARCATRVVRGMLPAATDCEVVTAAARVRAAARARGDVARRCCGRDGTCGTGDDVGLGGLGWTTPTCPDLDGSGCAQPIASAGDVGACVGCVADAAARVGLAAAVAAPTVPAAAARCRAAVVAATARAITARQRARVACWTAHLRGTRQGGCPADDAAVVRVDAALAAAVCTACGGADRACGGTDDFLPPALGFPTTCPAEPLAAGGDCARALATPADLGACVACVAGRAVDCATALAVPSQTTYPAACDPPRPACQAGATCTSVLDCPAGYACLDNGAGGTTRYCVGPECTGDGGCGGGGVCRQYCTRDGFAVTCGARRCQCPGFGCTGADQLCIDTGGLACRKVCLQDSDCVAPFGFVCVNPGFGFGLCIGNLACQ